MEGRPLSKGIFDTRSGSGYDDDPASRYHFPDRYLPVARTLVGNWVIYREPRRDGGRSGYVAVARVVHIEPDCGNLGHSYARVANYLEFDRVVPLDGPERAYEAILRAVPEPSRRGVALQGRSVRPVSDADFAAIVRAGLHATLDPGNAVRLELDRAHTDEESRALLDAPVEEQERQVVQVLQNRRVRDAAFRGQVLDAYDGRCAVTGLRIVNGGGKTEAQAAHIWAVQDGGPDVVRNGIALSATVHWLFDRHLISLTDDYGLLVSHNRVPVELRPLYERQLERIILPTDSRLHPHPAYVARHRERYLAS
jgi:putative restriction endonuclease